jgi:hypothetical protein
MRSECHGAYLSHPSAMRGETRSRKYFSHNSKVPYNTDRFKPNLHCTYLKRSEYNVAYFTHLTAMRGEYRRKTLRPLEECALYY